jgi:hypothetical protein
MESTFIYADGDAAALSNEIRRLLRKGTRAAPSEYEEEEEEEAVVAQVLEHLRRRPACLIHDNSGERRSRHRERTAIAAAAFASVPGAVCTVCRRHGRSGIVLRVRG